MVLNGDSSLNFCRLKIKDDPRSGRPKSAKATDIIKIIVYTVLEDRRLRLDDIATVSYTHLVQATFFYGEGLNQ